MHPGQKFDKYAILGDDVVICGIEVAKIYKQTLAELGVDISMSKSNLTLRVCCVCEALLV